MAGELVERDGFPKDDEAFVRLAYRYLLQRDADPEGLEHYVGNSLITASHFRTAGAFTSLSTRTTSWFTGTRSAQSAISSSTLGVMHLATMSPGQRQCLLLLGLRAPGKETAQKARPLAHSLASSSELVLCSLAS